MPQETLGEAWPEIQGPARVRAQSAWRSQSSGHISKMGCLALQSEVCFQEAANPELWLFQYWLALHSVSSECKPQLRPSNTYIPLSRARFRVPLKAAESVESLNVGISPKGSGEHLFGEIRKVKVVRALYGPGGIVDAATVWFSRYFLHFFYPLTTANIVLATSMCGLKSHK